MGEKWNIYPGPYHWYMSRFQELRYLRAFFFSKKYVKQGMRVLDVGGGDGRLSAELLKLSANVVLADHQLRPLRFAKLMVESPKISFAQMDGRELGVRAESVDVVTFYDVIEHLPLREVRIALAEIRRVLRPGGLLLLTTPNRKEFVGRFFGHVMVDKHYQEFTVDELHVLLQESGFVVNETKGIYFPLGALFERLACIWVFDRIVRAVINAGEHLPRLANTIFVAAKK